MDTSLPILQTFRFQNLNLKKYFSPGEISHRGSIDETGVNIDGVVYRNAEIIEYDKYVYIVSKKAVLTISITPICNAKCSFCYNGITFFPGVGVIDDSNSELLKVIDFSQAAGVRSVSISGGEPTLFPQQLLRIVEQLNGRFEGFIRIHTNGSRLLSKLTWHGKDGMLWEHLFKAGLKDISVSRAAIDPIVNDRIMRFRSGESYALNAFKELVAVHPDTLRLSCYLTEGGVSSPDAMVAYIREGNEQGINSFVFRLSSAIPSEFAIPGEFSIGNSGPFIDTNVFKDYLINLNYKLRFSRQEIDYDLFILEKDGAEVSIDRSSDVPDPDRKIRRILFMPNGLTYTSWLESSSFLFPDQSDLMGSRTRVANTAKPYPASASRHALYSKVQSVFADLHVHSLVSDGVLVPSEAMSRLEQAGITTFAFAEHNCFHDNWRNLVGYGTNLGITIPFPGTEISCAFFDETNKIPLYRFHLLAFGLPLMSDEFKGYIGKANKLQNEHVLKCFSRMCSQLNISDEVDIFTIHDSVPSLVSSKHLLTRTWAASFGIPYCDSDLSELKSKYFPSIDPKIKHSFTLNITEVIQRVRDLGGITILAHPGWVRPMHPNLDSGFSNILQIILSLKSAGLDGIELYHRLNSEEQVRSLLNLAIDTDMLVTGGSDFHGRTTDRLRQQGTNEANFDRIQFLLQARARVHKNHNSLFELNPQYS